jgi:hypothetical protein
LVSMIKNVCYEMGLILLVLETPKKWYGDWLDWMATKCMVWVCWWTGPLGYSSLTPQDDPLEQEIN